MLIRIKKILPFGLTARLMKTFLVEHERYLVRIKIHAHEPRMICVLAVEEKVPRVARTGLFEYAASIRHAAKYVRRTYVWKKDAVNVRDVGAGWLAARPIEQCRQTVSVIRNIKLKADADLMQIV